MINNEYLHNNQLVTYCSMFLILVSLIRKKLFCLSRMASHHTLYRVRFDSWSFTEFSMSSFYFA